MDINNGYTPMSNSRQKEKKNEDGEEEGEGLGT